MSWHIVNVALATVLLGPVAFAAPKAESPAPIAAPAINVETETTASETPQALVLFGVELNGATRAQIRAALKKARAKPLKLDNKGDDIYHASNLLEGAEWLAFSYNGADEFISGAYFMKESFMEAEPAVEMMDRVESKYGAPTNIRGSKTSGAMFVEWTSPDGMMIVVKRGWPDSTAILSYFDMTRTLADTAEKEAMKKRGYAKQSNAF